MQEVYSVEAEYTPIDSEIESLPNIPCIGKLPSLHTAMANDSSLKSLLKEYITTNKYNDRKDLIKPIILKWAKAENVPDKSRGSNVDARELAVLETVFARDFKGIDGLSNPNTQAGLIHKNIFKTFETHILDTLESQHHIKDLVSAISVNDDGSYDLSNVYKLNPDKTLDEIVSFREFLKNRNTDAEIEFGLNATKLLLLGNGTKESPFIIENDRQLQLINYLNSINSSAHYQLRSDIDLSGVSLTPIGESNKPFSGSFDGNGHTISNIIIEAANRDYVGFLEAVKVLLKT